MATVIRHIPKGEANSAQQVRTLCGRWVASGRCIDLRTTLLEDAECKSCQRSDDSEQVRRVKHATEPHSFGNMLFRSWTP